MFESQRHTQENLDVPHYAEILKFIDLRARASETAVCKPPNRHLQLASKSNTPIRTTYVANAVTACMSCSVGKHPLYVCREFRSASSVQLMNLVREHQFCFNCLKPGHFAPQCASDRKRQKCRKPHHTFLHSSFESGSMAKTANQDAKQSLPAKGDDSSTSHSSHLSSPNFGGQRSPLMMTCQIVVMTSDGRVMKARVLLDCVSSTSFVTEHLAWRLQLPHQRQHVQVAGIGGAKYKLSSRSVISLTVANKKSVNMEGFLGLNRK